VWRHIFATFGGFVLPRAFSIWQRYFRQCNGLIVFRGLGLLAEHGPWFSDVFG
jgi:hypothetical protein